MIQRKQTLFLLGVIFISALLFVFPIFYFTDSRGVVSIISLNPMPHSAVITSEFYSFVIMNLLIPALALFTIFKFKNRNLQFKLANLIALLNIILIGLFFLLNFIKPSVTGSISYKFGLSLPIISGILAYFAAHFIKKDEQLVRNADRIR
jgi:glucan phosphoethanolaminetransferase (alkaline phosphatase superfamily)